MKALIRKQIFEFKIMKQGLILPMILTIGVLISNTFISKNESFISIAMFNTTIINIIIAAWLGSYILKDLIEDDSSEIIQVYTCDISKIAILRFFKMLLYYGILVCFMSSVIWYFGRSELIYLNSIIAKFFLDGLVVMSLSYFSMSLFKEFTFSFSIVVSIGISFFVLIRELTNGMTSIVAQILHFYIEYFAIYNSKIPLNIKNIIFFIILIVIANKILKGDSIHSY